MSYSGGDCGVMSVGNDYVKALPAGVAVTKTLAISFNSLGSVNEACPGGRCVAMIGSHTFTVHAATGFIEVGQ